MLRPINENDYFLLFLSNVCIFPFKAAVSCLIKEYWPVLQILTDLADPPGTSFCGRVLEQVCLYMLKMHYPLRTKQISSTIVVLTGTSYCSGCGKRFAVRSHELLEAQKKVYRYCIGWEKG